jgi:hypothetical protein
MQKEGENRSVLDVKERNQKENRDKPGSEPQVPPQVNLLDI